jgi:hypothetical protein
MFCDPGCQLVPTAAASTALPATTHIRHHMHCVVTLVVRYKPSVATGAIPCRMVTREQNVEATQRPNSCCRWRRRTQREGTWCADTFWTPRIKIWSRASAAGESRSLPAAPNPMSRARSLLLPTPGLSRARSLLLPTPGRYFVVVILRQARHGEGRA